MSLAEQLHRLQQLDLELQRKQQELNEVEDQLSDNKALMAAELSLASQKDQLEHERKRQRDAEWELEDLQEKVRHIESKLYSGTTKNPKELVNLEIELRGYKGQIRSREDTLLALMSQVEEMETTARTTAEELERLTQEWQQRQETLGHRKGKVETVLAELRESRDALARQIDPEGIKIYEQIRSTRTQAVAKIERGECQGCHIALPTSQWQRARAGDLIQCGSCNRILYSE